MEPGYVRKNSTNVPFSRWDLAVSRRVAWSIEARGREGCQVNSLRFDAYSTVPWIWPRVAGVVDWNCGGREQTIWKLGRDGSLKEYWYSW